jgi:hypothetical protein
LLPLSVTLPTAATPAMAVIAPAPGNWRYHDIVDGAEVLATFGWRPETACHLPRKTLTVVCAQGNHHRQA